MQTQVEVFNRTLDPKHQARSTWISQELFRLNTIRVKIELLWWSNGNWGVQHGTATEQDEQMDNLTRGCGQTVNTVAFPEERTRVQTQAVLFFSRGSLSTEVDTTKIRTEEDTEKLAKLIQAMVFYHENVS